MRCLYCGKQLAFLRRLTGGGEFCSEAHKHNYHEEYNRIALSRLMQAQSKSDEIKPALPKPAGAAQLIKTTFPRDNEPSWTTVHRTGQRRISAPIEAPAPRPITSPPRANFIVDKPLLKKPAKVAASVAAAVQVFGNSDVNRPVLTARPETSFVPAAAGLLKTTIVPAARAWTGPQKKPAVAAYFTVAAPITTGLLPAVTCTAGLPLADLIELDATPIPPVLAEPEIESAIEISLSSELEVRGELSGGSADSTTEREDNRELFDQVPLQSYLPLTIRPFPPSKLISPILAGNLVPNLVPTLPANSPLPLRPKISTASPAASGTRQAAIKVSPGTAIPKSDPLQTETQVDARDVQKIPGNHGSDADLPQFLRAKEPDSSDKSGKMWDNVQKYLKNLVGCFLIASLFGVAGWNFRAGATAAAAQLSGAENSGESDRSRPERELFVYPESLALEDYRVEFEIPVTNKTIEWVFRAADPKNCYAMRLEPDAGPAASKLHIKKYVVVNGEYVASAAFRLLRPSDSKYAIKLEIRGSQFLTYSQGRLVDRWSDPTFSRGGFGYYSRGGEPAPIQSVRLTNLATMTRARSVRDQ